MNGPGGPVRLTIDLDPKVHRELSELAAAAAVRQGRPRVTLAAVVRAMIAAALENEDVATAVETELDARRWSPRSS